MPIRDLVNKLDKKYREFSDGYQVFEFSQDDFVTKLEQLDGNYRVKKNGVWTPRPYNGKEVRDEILESMPLNNGWTMFVYCEENGETVFEAFPEFTRHSEYPLDSRHVENYNSEDLATNIINPYAIKGESLSWEKIENNL